MNHLKTSIKKRHKYIGDRRFGIPAERFFVRQECRTSYITIGYASPLTSPLTPILTSILTSILTPILTSILTFLH